MPYTCKTKSNDIIHAVRLSTCTASFHHSMLATKLNMTPEEAEKWIVNLIRNVRLDARIDAKQVCIISFCYT